jgi:metallophosphoesterase superfamily enzyme
MKQFNKSNVLVIPDLHLPFTLDILPFFKKVQRQYDCGTVVLIGDIFDLHSVSRFPANPDGMSPGEELLLARKMLKPYIIAFPTAYICKGNHDLRITRKATANQLSEYFIRDLQEILEAPKGWKFVDHIILDNVLYTHGSVGDSFKRAKESRISTVSGHLHSVSFVQYSTSIKDTIFGMNVGAAIDPESYAAAYAKDMPKRPIVNCGVVLDKGTLPLLIPYKN